MKTTIAYVLARLQEASSWAGIAAALAAAGVALPPGIWKTVIAVGMIGAAAAAVLVKEGVKGAITSGDLAGAVETAAASATKAAILVGFLGAAGLGLVACSASSQVSTVAGLQTAYIGAVDAELAYAAAPGHSAAVLGQIGVYRVAAYNALQPLVTAAEGGGSVATAAEQEAAEAALTQLTTYMTSQGINPAAPATIAAAAQ